MDFGKLLMYCLIDYYCNSKKNPILLSQLLSGPSLPWGPSSPAFTVLKWQGQVLERLPFVPPTKKKSWPLFSNSFPIIYLLYFLLLLFLLMVRSQQTQTNIFQQASAGNRTRITSSRQQLSHYTTQDELKAVGLILIISKIARFLS